MSSTRALVADVIPASCVDGPGNRYVLFLQGCSFDCVACHNPHTICTRSTPTTRWASSEQVLDEVVAVAPFLSGVTVSGGEATLQWRFVLELFERLGEHDATRHLTRLVDSNGDAEPAVWDALAPSMEGAMVDLKALDTEVHRFLTARGNDRVLASIRHLDDLDRLAEVRLLVVPGVNDSSDQLSRTAEWLQRLRTAPPVTVLAFRHAGTRGVARRLREATDADVERVVAALAEGGLVAQYCSS